MRAALPYVQDQVRAALAAYDELLATGRPFLLGAAPCIADLAAYHSLWFIVARVGKPVPPLPEFPRVLVWMERVSNIGHGQPADLSGTGAIEIARSSTPAATEVANDNDPAGRKPGMKVKVTPDDTGRDPVVGELVGSSAREIVIRRTDERAGTVHVHFPRLGFVVAPAK